MILWLKRGTAAATFIFTIPLAMDCGTLWPVIPSALVNIGWAMSEKFSSLVQRLLGVCPRTGSERIAVIPAEAGIQYSCSFLDPGFRRGDEWRAFSDSLLAPIALIVNALVATYAVVDDGPAAWAILASGSSLVSWNAGLFWRRSPNASLSIQYHYLRRVGGMFVLGITMGISALALQGRFVPPFWLALSMMLAAGFLCLHLLSKTSLHGFEEK